MLRGLAFLAFLAVAGAQTRPIPIKVVVVAMFESGADTGDRPGEFQYWVERSHLDRVLPLPQGYHDLRLSRDGVLGTVTGVGTARAAASIMALGLDPRFDLTKAYWLVAGIAGIDPADGSIGSAAWAEWVVDGDLAYEVDAREIPKDWKTGYVPFRRTVPYEQPHRSADAGEIYHLNPALVDWAFRLTRDVSIPDTDALRAERSRYQSATARRPPFVLKGDTLSASTFWHGKLLDQWANDWVRYHSDGKANYVTSAMEHTGTLQTLTFLAKAGRVDLNRVLVLRTASDYDQPAPGETAAASLGRNSAMHYVAYLSALDSAWRIGRVVVEELVRHWDRYRVTPPAAHP